jgi:hypothetical protein
MRHHSSLSDEGDPRRDMPLAVLLTVVVVVDMVMTDDELEDGSSLEDMCRYRVEGGENNKGRCLFLMMR